MALAKALMLGGLAAAIAAAGAGLWLAGGRPAALRPAPEAGGDPAPAGGAGGEAGRTALALRAPRAPAAAPEPAGAPDPAASDRPPDAAAPGGAGDGTGDAPRAAGAGAPQAPEFDVVRVERDGAAVIAGRAAPGARVRVLLDDATLAEVTADGRGQFVALADAPPADRARELRLSARAPDGTERASAASVLVLPSRPDAAPAQTRAAAPRPALSGPQAAAPPPDPAVPSGAGAARMSAKGSGEAPGPAAARPILLRAEADGDMRPLSPAALGPVEAVTLDAVSYDADGAVRLSGRGAPGRRARIYADGLRRADAPIDAEGAWRAELPGLTAPGRYTLRVDEIDAAGEVSSRIESPFLREAPEALAAAPGRIVVQPGANLWTIARGRYGRGARFTLIYRANRDRIRDPDLIYPGQVFDLPAAPDDR